MHVLDKQTAKMTHKELMNEVQKRSGIDRHQSAMLLAALEHLLVEEAIELNAVELKGLGTFVANKHPEYISEDAQTGAVTMFPPRYSYRFQNAVEI